MDFGAGGVAGGSGEAGVDDVANAGDGEGGFCDVGGEDNAAVLVGFPVEDFLLFVVGEAGVEGEDVGCFLAGMVEVVGAEVFGGLEDVAFGGEEDEDVAVVRFFGDGG